MKKIIALALALIMALSMGVVAFAAPTQPTYAAPDANSAYHPGSLVAITDAYSYTEYKVKGYDFTTASEEFTGASLVKAVKLNKWNVLTVELKESYTLTDAKVLKGEITLVKKTDAKSTVDVPVQFYVNNASTTVYGEKKVADAVDTITPADQVWICDEDYAGYVNVKLNDNLFGTVKMAAKEKAYLSLLNTAKGGAGEPTKEAIDEVLGEDFDGIVEYYVFETKAFDNEVDFRYDAWSEDPHFFYAWDGEKLTAIDAKYDDDEDVDDYVFTAAAEGAIVVTDVEVVAAAEDTKNPDTGANDVVGVAAALAVVSLVAAGAVSLKK